MEEFCIDAGLLGTDLSLARLEGGYAWVCEAPEGCWRFTGRVKPCDDACGDSLLRLAQSMPPMEPEARYARAMAALGIKRDRGTPWGRIMPPEEHLKFVSGIVTRIEAAIKAAPVEYFRGAWSAGNRVLRALQRPFIDAVRYRDLVAAGRGNMPALESFAPGDDGRAAAITYDRLGTVTGRMTVAAGPQVLTLNKEFRSIIVPNGPARSIAMVDFSALEPRAILYEAGGSCSEPDLYAMLARDAGTGRDATKQAVITELYGGGRHALEQSAGLTGDSLTEFIAAISRRFDVAGLATRLRPAFYADGRIVNRYGRPVVVEEGLDRILVNYYAQSTGVDVALLGFDALLSSYRACGVDAVPLYVIHDALVVDVANASLDAVLGPARVDVPGFDSPFFVKGTLVG